MPKKPLVLDSTGSIQQLQAGDEADIPLEQRFQELERQFNTLVTFFLMEGFQVPDEVINEQ